MSISDSGTKVYLGDCVYLEYLENGDLRIYLDNGLGEWNEIFFDSDVQCALHKILTQYLGDVDA